MKNSRLRVPLLGRRPARPLGGADHLEGPAAAAPVQEWAPSPAVLRTLANALNQPLSRWVPLAGGSTSAVYRVPGLRAVVRVSDPETSVAVLRSHLRWAEGLTRAGVLFAEPMYPMPIVCGDARATVWVDLGDSGPVDFAGFGRALRSLHDKGTVALADDPTLRPVLDLAALTDFFDSALDRGLLAADEHEVLAGWPDRVRGLLAEVPLSPMVLVHDDVWVKNVVQRETTTVLVDPDNLAWGCRDYDLSFVVRAVEKGAMSPADGDAFESGYGHEFPDVDTAWTYAYVHRLRWVANLVRRRRLLASDEETLLRELPKWRLPRGPRDAMAA